MNWRPKHISQCLPCLVVGHGKQAIDFYTKAFGFVEHKGTAVDDYGNVLHAMLQLGDCTIMLSPEGAFDMPHKTPSSMGKPSPMGLYVYVEDVDALYKRAIDAGATAVVEPMNAHWGDRFCRVVDPDGYEWSFATQDEKLMHHHHHGDGCC
jgi:uncharacterized glyoxalase superfamily protein PhnB